MPSKLSPQDSRPPRSPFKVTASATEPVTPRKFQHLFRMVGSLVKKTTVSMLTTCLHLQSLRGHRHTSPPTSVVARRHWEEREPSDGQLREEGRCTQAAPRPCTHLIPHGVAQAPVTPALPPPLSFAHPPASFHCSVQVGQEREWLKAPKRPALFRDGSEPWGPLRVPRCRAVALPAACDLPVGSMVPEVLLGGACPSSCPWEAGPAPPAQLCTPLSFAVRLAPEEPGVR